MESRLKQLMRERGLKAESLAKLLGDSLSAVRSVMKRDISTMLIADQYAKALRIPVWELFYDCEVSAIGHELPEWSERSENYIPGCPVRISEVMREKKIQQIQLAESIGMLQPQIAKVVHSRTNSVKTLERFASALNIEPYELFISKEDMQREIARRKGEPVAERVVSMEQPERKPMEDSYQEDLFAQNETTASDDDMIITMGGRRYRLVPMD